MARPRPAGGATWQETDMKIGEVAKKAGCQVVTIRYYEKEGLLPEPERSEGN